MSSTQHCRVFPRCRVACGDVLATSRMFIIYSLAKWDGLSTVCILVGDGRRSRRRAHHTFRSLLLMSLSRATQSHAPNLANASTSPPASNNACSYHCSARYANVIIIRHSNSKSKEIVFIYFINVNSYVTCRHDMITWRTWIFIYIADDGNTRPVACRQWSFTLNSSHAADTN